MPLDDRPEDWTEPGAYRVADGVHRIPLPLEIDGLHAVNVYAIEDAGTLTVIDSGWAGAKTRAALDAGLAALGAQPGDVTDFVITHAHWDHYTHALAMRREFGTRVRLGLGERPTIEGFDISAGPYPEQARRLVRCGAPDLAAAIDARIATDEETAMEFGAPDSWLEDGEKVAVGGRTLEVFETPGHTRGHIVLRDSAAGVLFAGDHILPHITPSIGLEHVPEVTPLRSYLASLALIREQSDLILLPAHGHVTLSVHTRIEELLAHHEQRLAAVADHVRDGRGTAFEIAQGIRWTRRERRLEDLEDIHQMTAVLEIQAHLDVLLEAGEVVAIGGQGDPWMYSTR